MKLTANFTLDELIKSQVAERKGINNNPSPEQIENLKALAVNILQPIRSHYNEPLQISSGFRCAELCIAIGSSINSQHVADDNAAAADFEIWGKDNKEVASFIKSELEFDQLILEFYKEGEKIRAGFTVVILLITIEINVYMLVVVKTVKHNTLLG